ncbi:MAG: glycosyltransferase family 2 protein [Nitrospirae bacterium]|nr:glycosyltransferase family 2 protein [Nitrospirota bacterium]MBF0541769.1 glycosyltransferase family 2 protein [Nitrospirota bacterium]
MLYYFLIFLIIYPYVIYPIVLFFLALIFSKKPEQGDELPIVSLVISAYNEERVIEAKIKNSLELDYPRLEIIIASESNDSTNEIVKGYEGIRLFAFEGREGKAATLYRVIPQCSGEIIIFSDANGMYEKEAIRKLVRNFKDKGVGCVSGRMKYINPNQTSIGKGESIYWNYEFIIKKLSSRLQHLLGANGCIFALRKEAWLPLSKYRGDDFELPINAGINGYKVILEPEAIAYEEVTENFRDEYKRKVRIMSWNFISALMLLREAVIKGRVFIGFQLISHKILRWLTPFFLIALLINNIMIIKEGQTIYFVTLILQLGLYLSAIIGLLIDKFTSKRLPKILLIPYYYCMTNYASMIAIIRSIFREDRIWEKNR